MAATVSHPHPPSDTATVTGLPLNEYEAIVKPHRQFLISDYFINHWVSRLNPTLAWIVIALQQACWRADSDHCTISQEQICQEVGINRSTITRSLKNPLSHWLIPQVTYNQATFNVRKQAFQPLPAQYSVYLSPPLVPEHLTGLYGYFKASATAGRPAAVRQAIQQLLEQPTKKALKILCTHSASHPCFVDPLPLSELVEAATGLQFASLPPPQATRLKQQLATLQSHLTRGDTLCRQYFRLNWTPVLGTSMAWLVLILRSRCYYNKTSGELRDTYTWRKKDLAGLLGQSTQNLRTRLLKHPYAAHFFQIIDDAKHKLTIRVGMLEEPLTTESAATYWQRQAQNAKICHIDPAETQRFATSTPTERKDLPHRPPSNAKICHIDPAETQTFATQSPKTLENKTSKTDTRPTQPTLFADVAQEKTETADRPPPLSFSKRQQCLFDVLCRLPLHGMQPHIARKMVLTCSEADLLGWLHYVSEDRSVKDPVRLLVASLLQRGEAPPQPPDEPDRRQQRYLREVTWGLRQVDVLAPDFEPGPEINLSPLEQLWQETLTLLSVQTTQAVFDAWLKPTQLVQVDAAWGLVAVQSEQAQAWLANRLRQTVERAFAQVLGRSVQLDFVTRTALADRQIVEEDRLDRLPPG